ncbi:ribosomal protein S18-alanine N-acetyltransferase [Jeongeupia naejangsanensis]|uniref:[Ribosomal protein bS18]-alanine N-acetyltransferase n=1 Tax=Jeongeupia naejangsanensis TaxID=613195 RepID=A0ABS2BIE2_9NEIS|nr:ribosomal protein S18-alanine N-acetyltransferase [Jeongeupia naejangsanensis]MBM3115376.1 ribosomal protein S18-alanine N-acetyltransferase [Jeongeupia naejangsanensis]
MLRPLVADDLDALVALDAATNPHPWSAGLWRDALARDHGTGLIDDDNRLVGFTVSSRVLDEAELQLIAVSPERQRQGLGRRLLESLLSELRRDGIARLLLEVRAGNHGAQALYAGCGGIIVGRRKGYYDHGREDALLYTFTLGGEAT